MSIVQFEPGFVSNVITTVNYQTLPRWEEFTKTKIRGVTRFEIPWDKLEPGTELQMFEDNGHVLFAYDNQPLGWIKPIRAKAVKHLLSAGFKFKASVLQVTGGIPGKPNRGCNILIDIKNPLGAVPVKQDTDGNIHSKGE